MPRKKPPDNGEGALAEPLKELKHDLIQEVSEQSKKPRKPDRWRAERHDFHMFIEHALFSRLERAAKRGRRKISQHAVWLLEQGLEREERIYEQLERQTE